MALKAEEFVSNFLTRNEEGPAVEHYGVLGMKWGVRKDRGSSASRRRRSGSKDYQTTKNLRSKRRSSLTNQELKKVNQRLQLERTYSDLTSSMNFVKKAVAAGGTISSAYALSQTPLGKKATSFVRRSLESERVRKAYRRAMGG